MRPPANVPFLGVEPRTSGFSPRRCYHLSLKGLVGRQDSNLHLRCVGGLCLLSYGQEGSVQLRVAGASRQGLSPVRCTGRRWHAVRPLHNTVFPTVHRPSRSRPGGADWAAPSVLTTAATRGGPPGHVPPGNSDIPTPRLRVECSAFELRRRGRCMCRLAGRPSPAADLHTAHGGSQGSRTPHVLSAEQDRTPVTCNP